MNDPSMERIREANPYPVPLAPLPIEPVWRRIAEDGPSPRMRRRRLPVPDLGGAVAALGASVAVAIAILAILTIGHRDRAGSPADAGSSRSPAAQVGHITAQRRELVTSLGVLRRPQTRADRDATLPSPFSVGRGLSGAAEQAQARLRAQERAQAGDPTIDRPLLRMITTSAGDQISVVPETWQPSRRSAARAEGIAIAIHTPGNRQSVDTGPRPVSVAFFETHGLAVFNDTRRGAVLVPDGVARVTLVGFGPLGAGGHVRLDTATIAGRTATVHDNLATFTLSGLTATGPSGSSDQGGGFAVRMVWFNASGQAIAHPTTEFSTLYVTVHGPASGRSSAGTQTLGTTQLDNASHGGAFTRAAGTARRVRAGGRIGLELTASGLPRTPSRTAYGVWLVSASTERATFLGYIASQPREGRTQAEVALAPSMVRSDTVVELTIERQHGRPAAPGTVVLRGALP